MPSSWADIVKGPAVVEAEVAAKIAEAERAPRVPGLRGSCQCQCRGEVLVMLGHYGWIMSLDPIEHPDISKTSGRIYIAKKDVQGGCSLGKGDIVTFFLYVDEQGLGAEACTIEEEASSKLSPSASEFVPQVSAQEFVPQSHWAPAAAAAWNVAASEFRPMTSSWNVAAYEFQPSMPAEPTGQQMCAFNLAFFSDDSDEESDDDKVTSKTAISSLATLNKAEVRPPSSGGSTAADSSDVDVSSDDEPEPCRFPAGFVVPPGFKPPPGLRQMAAAA